MASDGGPMYPHVTDSNDPDLVVEPGMSVRDGFAMVIASQEDWNMATKEDETRSAEHIYDFAQALTDEKLRRDKADHDKGKAG